MRIDNHPIHKILSDKGFSLEDRLNLHEIDSILREVDVSSVVTLVSEDALANYFKDVIVKEYPDKIWKDLSPAIQKAIIFVQGRALLIGHLAKFITKYNHSQPAITGFLFNELDRLPFYLRILLQVPEDVVEFLGINNKVSGKARNIVSAKQYNQGLVGKELGIYTQSISRQKISGLVKLHNRYLLFKYARNRVIHDVVESRKLPLKEEMPAVSAIEKEIREKVKLADEYKVIKSFKAVKKYYKLCMCMDAKSGVRGKYFLTFQSLDIFLRLLPNTLKDIDVLRN